MNNIVKILGISFDDIFPYDSAVRIFEELHKDNIWPMKVCTDEMEPLIPKNSFILVLKGAVNIHNGDIVIAMTARNRLGIVKVYFDGKYMVWRREKFDDIKVEPIKHKGYIFGKIIRLSVDIN